MAHSPETLDTLLWKKAAVSSAERVATLFTKFEKALCDEGYAPYWANDIKSTDIWPDERYSLTLSSLLNQIKKHITPKIQVTAGQEAVNQFITKVDNIQNQLDDIQSQIES